MRIFNAILSLHACGHCRQTQPAAWLRNRPSEVERRVFLDREAGTTVTDEVLALLDLCLGLKRELESAQELL
jgi:hypothetical protein